MLLHLMVSYSLTSLEMLQKIKNGAFVYLSDKTFELSSVCYVNDRQIILKRKCSYIPNLFGAFPV